MYGQFGFPSGTTIRCYGSDSTCSVTPNDTTLDYAAVGESTTSATLRYNPCCLEPDVFIFHPDNYYTALGSRCQSCSGKKCL